MKQPLPMLLAIILCAPGLAGNAGNKKRSTQPSFNSPASEIKMLSSSLYSSNGNIADGNRVVFDAQYSNAVDGNDALKLVNPGENFGLLRDNRLLAVEARQPITNGDTLFFSMVNLIPQLYRLEIAVQNLSAMNMECRLIDRYLNTTQLINLTDSNHLNLEITSDPSSRMNNRLMIVFSNPVITVPFRFSGISAINNANSTVMINWNVSNEMNIAYYEIERSADNISFYSLASRLPFYNAQDHIVYNFSDNSPLVNDNIYRIKATGQNGQPVYSDKVKVAIVHTSQGVHIYPNPVTEHYFNLRLQKMNYGKYQLIITNSSGQKIYNCAVNINSDNYLQRITLDQHIGKGIYNVSLWDGDGIRCTQKLIVN